MIENLFILLKLIFIFIQNKLFLIKFYFKKKIYQF